MRLSSRELWENLEGKIIQAYKQVENTDSLLAYKLSSLVNHFNGNLAKNTQFVVIDNVDAIIKNITHDSYYRERGYSKELKDVVTALVEDMTLILKVLRAEYAEHVSKSKLGNSTNPTKEKLPNINNEKAMNMFEPKKTDLER